MNSAQHDELAQLFAQNMHLSQQQQHLAPVAVESLSSAETKIDSPVHFASAHYTQTAHVQAETRSEPTRSPPPPYQEEVMPEAMAETLRQHSIDPSALLSNQVDLFRNADYEQRLRLLELWRIAPPSYPLDKHLQVQSQFIATSVEKEEQDARMRYEQQMQARQYQEEHMLDTRVADPAVGNGLVRDVEVEPYIVNGYEMAASRRAVEPVYASGLWHAQEQQQLMENNYGMYEQIRCHADWERMNQQIAREKFVGLHEPLSMDDDMVM